MTTIDTRRRVKHYVLNDARQWVDRGTGHVSWIYNDKQRSVSLIVKSESDSSILLEAKILLSIVYQRQQDTLIVWSDTSRRDLALSFQEKAGCDEIWEKICEVLGEDSSLDTTSSRGSSGNGSGSNGNDNLDESDEDQLESDINTSPTSDLPACELNKLKEIRDFFILELPRKSKIYKERLASILESDSYIKKLIEIFHICEDLENMEGLNFLFEIFRSLFYLNKSSLLDILLSDDLIMDVIGCLEYDPNKTKDSSTLSTCQLMKHRQYITTKSNFKEIISFENSDLVNKIHQTYKVQYIQDVILPAPSVFEENSLTSLSSFIFLNKVEISNLIQEDERFLNELFEHLKNSNLDTIKRKDMLLFLREFTSFLHGLQQTRDPFFRSLYEHGILDVIEITLDLRDNSLCPIAIDILSHLVEVSPTMVREYILNEIESKSSIKNLNSSLNKGESSQANKLNQKKILSPPSVSSVSSSNNQDIESSIDLNKNVKTDTIDTHLEHDNNNNQRLTLDDILNTDNVFEPILVNYVIRQMINDPDPELSGAMQIINILKVLIDPENMLSAVNKAEKSEFLSYFYRKSMTILINPLMNNTGDLEIKREDFRIAQLQNLILDFLSFCVEHHTFHIKNYVLHKDLLKRILVLLKSKHQFLALSSLKFLRKTLGLKEDTYNKHIIKHNLFKPVVNALNSNGSRYNILNSAIIELFDFIRSDDIKSLMVYVIENFYQDLESINYVKTFRDLKLRYEQHKEKLNDHLSRSRLNSSESTSNGASCTTPSLYRTRSCVDRYHDRLDFDKDEDAWIEDDDDEMNNENRIDSTTKSKEHSSNVPQIDQNSLSSSSSSTSPNSNSNSNSNEENSQSDLNHNQFESYLEFKKTQSQLNIDDNEDTLFSPAKTCSTPPTSPTSSANSNSGQNICGSSRKSSNKSLINIKISTNTAQAINKSSCSIKNTNEENTNSLNLVSTSSPSSSNSPSSSPLTSTSTLTNGSRKHALVDYEDDSEDEDMSSNSNEEEENSIKSHFQQKLSSITNNEVNSEYIYDETKEPLAKRQATESNSILSKLVTHEKANMSSSMSPTNVDQLQSNVAASEQTLSLNACNDDNQTCLPNTNPEDDNKENKRTNESTNPSISNHDSKNNLICSSMAICCIPVTDENKLNNNSTNSNNNNTTNSIVNMINQNGHESDMTQENKVNIIDMTSTDDHILPCNLENDDSDTDSKHSTLTISSENESTKKFPNINTISSNLTSNNNNNFENHICQQVDIDNDRDKQNLNNCAHNSLIETESTPTPITTVAITEPPANKRARLSNS